MKNELGFSSGEIVNRGLSIGTVEVSVTGRKAFVLFIATDRTFLTDSVLGYWAVSASVRK